jgi:hypothetical protein
MPRTRKQHRELGSHHASGAVSTEGHEAAKRWTRDLTVLTPYGYTPTQLQLFQGMLAEHDGLRAARPEAVSAKLAAVGLSRGIVEEVRGFLDRTDGIFTVLARTNEAVEPDVQAIANQKANGLDAVVAATVELLRKHQALLDPAVNPAALIADGEALVGRLKSAGPDKAAAKTATVVDTEEIDVADGRILEVIRGLNSSGRKAFRALKQKAKVEEYKYHHLRGKPSETDPAAPAEDPAK